MNFMDFHCHLDMEDFNGQRREIVDGCFSSGFSRIVTVADPYEKTSFEKTAEILTYHPHIFCMAGAHPHNADQYTVETEKNLLWFIDQHKPIALGEVGLDFHYNFSKPSNQLRVLKRQIALASGLKLPLVIHSRNAEKQVLKTLDEARFEYPVIFHCYTGGLAEAREILKRGYYISISGIVTFKNSGALREIVRQIPLHRIFCETDAPYLSPEPFRGKLNSPLRVQLVVEKIAEVKGISVPVLNNAVNHNFDTLFPGQK